LAADTPRSVKPIDEGLLLLLGLKWLHSNGQPTVFSKEFGAAWCGVSEISVKVGLRWLLAEEYIKEDDKVATRTGKPMNAYLPVKEGEQHA
jgi:hypothetical protein